MVYLVRHGEATTDRENPDRPLTETGRRQTARVARAAARAGVRPGAIWHSGKLRARQTAEVLGEGLLGEELDGAPELLVREGLSPMDDPGRMRVEVEAREEPVMLVGHLPHLGRLASSLLCGSPDREIVDLRTSGMMALIRASAGWRLAWYVTPELT